MEKNVDVKPVAGIGHRGNGVIVLMDGGPLKGPIDTVVEDQFPKTIGPSQLSVRTLRSKVPHHPGFHVIIPVA